MANDPNTNPTGAQQDILAARPILPALIATVYGCYGFYEFGLGAQNYLYTYALVGGGVASVVSVLSYVAVIYSPPGRSWKKMMAALSGMIPYVFSLYLMGFLGIYPLWLLVAEGFGVGRFLFAVVWILLGYRMLYTFWEITEIGEARRQMEQRP